MSCKPCTEKKNKLEKRIIELEALVRRARVLVQWAYDDECRWHKDADNALQDTGP